MPKFPQGGRVKVSTSVPPLFESLRPISSETKYYGLLRDNALSDVEEPIEALSEVLRDIQNPAEAATLGIFTAPDFQIIEGIVRYDLKKEDFEVLENASINVEDENGNLSPAISPRQRIADRIKQSESFAGRGTVYQGQGTVMYKYMVPTDEVNSVNSKKYSHTNPPPFFTEDIDSSAENAPDHIPTLAQVPSTHRIGVIIDGAFEPRKENEYWWSGAYFNEVREQSEYGSPTDSAADNPKFPIVRDGNLNFAELPISGITQADNWGLRFDAWFDRSVGEINSLTETYLKFAAFVNGHLRIDYFEKTGYDANGAIQGSWKTALDTTDSTKYYIQDSKEVVIGNNALGVARRYVQGGPATATGAGDGTSHTPRSATAGGAWDLSSTYPDQESNDVDTFGNYVPVIIRFWYGQKDEETTGLNPIDREPFGEPGFVLDYITTNAADITTWNDYSSQMRVQYDSANGYWARTAGDDANFSNFNDIFEIIAYSTSATQPDSVDDYDISPVFISGVKNDSDPTKIEFNIPGLNPSNGDQIWIVLKNRAFNAPPGDRGGGVMWQRLLFHPDPSGIYSGAEDMLEGVGSNYIEPDPSREVFDLNYEFYKAKYGNLPDLNTYGADRYDGFIPTSITDSAGARDYDYDHAKLLFIGRQKKGTEAEIGDGTTNPNKIGKNLATGETRNKGENYTFLRVIKNEAGFGGNVVINACPSNNLSVLTTTSTGQFAKFLHMGDNTKTYSGSNRQNITSLSKFDFPSDSDFNSGERFKYEIIGGQGTLSAWTSGNAYDTTGKIATLTLGGATRNKDIKSIFISNFRTDGGTEYNFRGFIGATREAFENQQISVNSGGTTITSSGLFPNNGDSANNNQYIGTQIEFLSGDGGAVADTKYVTAYDASTETVTYSGAKTAQNYYVNVWYNHFKLGGVFPNKVIDTSGNAQTYTISDGNEIQISGSFNSGYQFERVDNGAGLSFSETLFFKESGAPTGSSPFSSDTEAPAPPADIVTPFGYDNTPSSSDPGLGGLCYPPYSIQNIQLQYLVKSDSELYSENEGNFDIWWGGRNVSLTDLDNKSLTVTDKLLFDFDTSDRSNLISTLASNEKPAFTGSEYTHKLEVELNVDVPDGPGANANLYADVIKYSDGNPVKDKFYLFINKSGSDLELISANQPDWSA